MDRLQICKKTFSSSFAVVTDPKVLIEGVLFRARYLGSTQLVSRHTRTIVVE